MEERILRSSGDRVGVGIGFLSTEEISDRVQGQGCSRNQFVIDAKTSHL